MANHTPRYHCDDGSIQSKLLRAQFEDWYVSASFDYEANPLGSTQCDLQWRAWLGARRAAAALLPRSITSDQAPLYFVMAGNAYAAGWNDCVAKAGELAGWYPLSALNEGGETHAPD